MYYVYSQTGGDTRKHLYLRYYYRATNLFISVDEMLDYLKGALIDPNKVREAKWKYDRLSIVSTKTFFKFKTKFLHLVGVVQVPKESLQMDLYDRLIS